MKKNSEYRKIAAETLNGNWVTSAVSVLIYILVQVGLELCLGEKFSWLSTFLLFPMGWAVTVLFLNLLRGEEPKYAMLFEGYKNGNFVRVCGTLLLETVYLILWSLLLLIPGLIKSYAYAMTSYILRDNPELQYNAAIERSMVMMQGHKMQLFLLHLSFIGWGILCILTLGIGFIFLVPYIQTSEAAFYEDLKAELAECDVMC